MNLLIDIGNTRIKAASWWQGQIKPICAQFYGNDLKSGFANVLQKIEFLPQQTLVAAVAGGADFAQIERMLNGLGCFEVKFARTATNFAGLKNSYDHPSRMGVDRWLAMVAASAETEVPLCVVSCGSALTVDVVSKGRKHLGGYIVPGLHMAESCLLRETEQIHIKEENQPDGLAWGTSTEQAVQGGVLMAATVFIEACFQRLEKEEQLLPQLVLTGGDSALIKKNLSLDSVVRPQLVLEGLALNFGLFIDRRD